MRSVSILSVALLLAACGSAYGAVANFDNLTAEMAYGHSLTDGGITFYDFDWHVAGYEAEFVVDSVEADRYLGGSSVVTQPNVLTVSGWSTGGLFWARWGEVKMTTNRVETFASLDLFTYSMESEWLGNTVTLEATRNGVVVAQDSDVLDTMWGQHSPLSISGVEFDTLRLYGSGTGLDGDFQGVLDNVVIAPEPGFVGLAVLYGLLCVRRRR